MEEDALIIMKRNYDNQGLDAQEKIAVVQGEKR